MSITKGLANINALIEKPLYDGPKVRWVKLGDNQQIKARFIEELDEDSAHYSADRGLAVVIQEHVNPKEYKLKAQCTESSEGRCFGCEMSKKEPKAGWRARMRFYCNLIVDDGVEAPYAAVWSQGISKQSAFNVIKEYAQELGSISNIPWKLRRKGTGTDTSYTLMAGTPDTEPFDFSKYEPFNLEKVVREIPYSEQEAFYFGFDGPSKDTESGTW